MNIEEYQYLARQTAIYPREHAVIYPALGLTGESGEVAEKVKKWLRDGLVVPEDLHKEVGDVLWYLANLCADMQEKFGDKYSLGNAAENNIKKLKSRKERGMINGSGDNR